MDLSVDDGCMQMDEWVYVDGWMDELINEDGWIFRGMDGWVGGWMDEWIWMDDGWMNTDG